MPYRFVENDVMVSYMGITIYHVSRNNYEDNGWRDYWYTKEQYGCEDDDDAFDIRDLSGYNSDITAAANFVNMIRNGEFGPPPDGYDPYVDEENSEAGVCPVCQSRDLDYDALEVLDEAVKYPFSCNNCTAEGNEYASLEFNGFEMD